MNTGIVSEFNFSPAVIQFLLKIMEMAAMDFRAKCIKSCSFIWNLFVRILFTELGPLL